MRSSSMKPAIAAVIISVALLAVAPRAGAREHSSRKAPVVQRAEGPGERAIRLARAMMRRLLGGVGTHGDGPSVPIPMEQAVAKNWLPNTDVVEPE